MVRASLRCDRHTRPQGARDGKRVFYYKFVMWLPDRVGDAYIKISLWVYVMGWFSWHDSCILQTGTILACRQANRSDPVLCVARFLHKGYFRLAGSDIHTTHTSRQAMQAAHSRLACGKKDTQDQVGVTYLSQYLWAGCAWAMLCYNIPDPRRACAG